VIKTRVNSIILHVKWRKETFLSNVNSLGNFQKHFEREFRINSTNGKKGIEQERENNFSQPIGNVHNKKKKHFL